MPPEVPSLPHAPAPYPPLNPVRAQLVAGARGVLGEDFVGAYLQGSFAAGDSDEHSDVDFIIVTTTDLAEAQLNELQALHARIYELDTSWAQHLDGSYFPRQVLRHH